MGALYVTPIEKPPERSRISEISNFSSILASISIIISSFIKNYPLWILYISIGMLIIFSIISIYPSLKSYIFSKYIKIRDNALAKKYFLKLKSLVVEFNNYYMNSHISDNIPYFINYIVNKQRQTNKEFGISCLFPIGYLYNIFYSINKVVDIVEKNKDNLRLLDQLFFELLHTYNKECVCMPIDKLKSSNIILDNSDIKLYRKYKHQYTSFIDKCKDFGTKVNNSLGYHVNPDFDFPDDF